MMQKLLIRAHRAMTLNRLRALLYDKHREWAHLHEPVPGRLLYVPAQCRPWHANGYAARTHELLCALHKAGTDLRVLTRLGYPWDSADSLGQPAYGSSVVDDILYEHEQRPTNKCFTAVFAERASRVIAAYARRHRVARIHAASNHTNALPALLAARQLGIPFQYEMRGLWELSRAARQPGFATSPLCRLGLELEAFVARRASRVFVISRQLGEYMHTCWNIPAHKLRLLPNCVDVERIKPINCEVQPHTIGYAGSLVHYEGLDTLLQAVALLKQRQIPVQVHIMGEGEARPDLEAFSTRLDLHAQIRFWNRVKPEEARQQLAQCALVCIPRKPFQVCQLVPPLKLAEAQALGKAVVVPDMPLFREEMGPEPGGYFFQAGDAGHLADVLAEALASPRLPELGALGRRNIMARRQWAHFTDDIMKGKGPCLVQ
ncbi:MAG: glycosyltransferase [Desulfovibrio sp.]|nr:glycosyltransferase [Desulfovibrio sp.]